MNKFDLELNYNSIPCESDVCILATAWAGQRKWMEKTLESYKKADKFVLMSYDPHWYEWNINNNFDQYIPNIVTLSKADSIIFRHVTYNCTLRNGWFWNWYYAQGILRQFPNFKYIFWCNSDCIWEKPEGIQRIIELLGDGDLISASSDTNIIHTCSVLYKAETFYKIGDFMMKRMRTPVIGSHSPERMLLESVKYLKLKEIKAEKQPIHPKTGHIDHYNCYNQDSTWKDVLGFRNLAEEIEVAAKERLEIPEGLKEYMDYEYGDGIYLNDHEKATLRNYFLTSDRRWLQMFWDQGSDSDFDRRYYPLDHYGKNAIYE